MADRNGYIKVNRSLMDWEWYSDINVSRVFLHLLLNVNFKDTKWRGVDLKRGELITSFENLSLETGLSVQSVRTCINRLKSTGEITCKSTSRFTLITIVKWADYQDSSLDDNKPSNTLPNKRVTNSQQTSNKQVTTDEECKEVKNDKNVKKKSKYGAYAHVLLTLEENEKLHSDYQNADELIAFLDEYIEMKGYKAKNHNLAIRRWVVSAVDERKPKQAHSSNAKPSKIIPQPKIAEPQEDQSSFLEEFEKWKRDR